MKRKEKCVFLSIKENEEAWPEEGYYDICILDEAHYGIASFRERIQKVLSDAMTEAGCHMLCTVFRIDALVMMTGQLSTDRVLASED